MSISHIDVYLVLFFTSRSVPEDQLDRNCVAALPLKPGLNCVASLPLEPGWNYVVSLPLEPGWNCVTSLPLEPGWNYVASLPLEPSFHCDNVPTYRCAIQQSPCWLFISRMN